MGDQPMHAQADDVSAYLLSVSSHSTEAGEGFWKQMRISGIVTARCCSPEYEEYSADRMIESSRLVSTEVRR